jgi:hypothetical protein
MKLPRRTFLHLVAMVALAHGRLRAHIRLTLAPTRSQVTKGCRFFEPTRRGMAWQSVRVARA